METPPPPQIFALRGHGELILNRETPGFVTLPSNIKFLNTTSVGKPVLYSEILRMIELLRSQDQKLQEWLADFFTNKDKIQLYLNVWGGIKYPITLSVANGGQSTPDFKFIPFSYFPGDQGTSFVAQSGVIPKNDINNSQSKTFDKSTILSMFEHSLYPTKDEVSQFISSSSDPEVKKLETGNILTDNEMSVVAEKINRRFEISFSDLLQTFLQNIPASMRIGIVNLTCRVAPEKTPPVELQLLRANSVRNVNETPPELNEDDNNFIENHRKTLIDQNKGLNAPIIQTNMSEYISRTGLTELEINNLAEKAGYNYGDFMFLVETAIDNKLMLERSDRMTNRLNNSIKLNKFFVPHNNNDRYVTLSPSWEPPSDLGI